MTPIRHRITRAALALVFWTGAGALFVGAVLVLGAPSAHAQLPLPGDGFAWERVGDRPIDIDDLAFGYDGTLWAGAGDGPYRLDTTAGAPGTWVRTRDFSAADIVLPLGRAGAGPETDTVLVAGNGTLRSFDGAQTFEVATEIGDLALYEVPAGTPNAGWIFTGEGGGSPMFRDNIAFSDDRGATWTVSELPPYAGAYDFVALPDDAVNPGRVLAVGTHGVVLSDDGGETFTGTDLFAFGFTGHRVALTERPGGGVRVLLIGYDGAQPHLRAWTSDDEGQTWTDRGALPEGEPFGPGGKGAGLFALGGSETEEVLAVAGRGTVYYSHDAGTTWEAVGRAPEMSEARFLNDAALDAEGRLYVGIGALGTENGWAWRTATPVSVAAEGPPEPGERSATLTVRPNPSRGLPEVSLTLTSPSEVSAGVYDVLGRRVATLPMTAMGPGRHVLPLSAPRLAPGVYVVRAVVETSGGGETRALSQRLTLVR